LVGTSLAVILFVWLVVGVMDLLIVVELVNDDVDEMLLLNELLILNDTLYDDVNEDDVVMDDVILWL